MSAPVAIPIDTQYRILFRQCFLDQGTVVARVDLGYGRPMRPSDYRHE